MSEVTVAAHLAAAPDRVWTLLADAARWVEWMPGLESCEVTNGQAGGVGRRQRLAVSYGGHRGLVDVEITEWEPGARIAWVHVSSRIEGLDTRFARDARTRVTLAPAPGGTALSFQGTWVPVGSMGKMMSGTLIRSRAQSMFKRAARNLERLASGTPESPPPRP